jgi:hypothetical protein
MKVSPRVTTGLAVLLVAWPVFAQQPIFYPAKGQRQQTDIGECQGWAKQNTGVDPAALAQQAGQPAAPTRQGGAVRGAAVGAVGGAIGGDAGRGAAIGAATRRDGWQSAPTA